MEEDPAPRRSAAAARSAEVEKEVQCSEITGQKEKTTESELMSCFTELRALPRN